MKQKLYWREDFKKVVDLYLNTTIMGYGYISITTASESIGGTSK